MRLLLVEDEAELAELVAENLQRDGFAVDVAGRIGDARATLSTTTYELLLLDLRLPDGDGLDLIRWLRREGNAMPIVVLTARDQLRDRVDGLNAGADDYLVKPFAHEELVARARAVLRRPTTALGPRLAIANLTLEMTNGEVFVARTVSCHGSKDLDCKCGEPCAIIKNGIIFHLMEYMVLTFRRTLRDETMMRHALPCFGPRLAFQPLATTGEAMHFSAVRPSR